MKIKFSEHAKLKFEILKRHHFVITEKQVNRVITKPDRVEQGRKGRMIAQKATYMKNMFSV